MNTSKEHTLQTRKNKPYYMQFVTNLLHRNTACFILESEKLSYDLRNFHY